MAFDTDKSFLSQEGGKASAFTLASKLASSNSQQLPPIRCTCNLTALCVDPALPPGPLTLSTQLRTTSSVQSMLHVGEVLDAPRRTRHPYVWSSHPLPPFAYSHCSETPSIKTPPATHRGALTHQTEGSVRLYGAAQINNIATQHPTMLPVRRTERTRYSFAECCLCNTTTYTRVSSPTSGKGRGHGRLARHSKPSCGFPAG